MTTRAARVVVRAVRDRFELTPFGIREEEADRDPVVTFAPLDSLRVETLAQLRALLLAHAHGGVVARPAALVEREPRVADVPHHRMPFCADNSRPERAPEEGRDRAWVVGLECDVIDACHAPPPWRAAC